MNIRENLRRYLIETGQVVQSRRYKWLIAIYLILVLVSAFHVFEPEYWQMRRVRRHIADISPQWGAFKGANPGFEAVELFPKYDEAYGVRFAAKGQVATSSSKANPIQQIEEFMWSTKPPSSVGVDASRVSIILPPSMAARQIHDRLHRLGFQEDRATADFGDFVMMKHVDGRGILVPRDAGGRSVSLFVDQLREFLRASHIDENDFFEEDK